MTGLPRPPLVSPPPPAPAPTSNLRLLVPVGLIAAGLVGLIGGLLPWVSISIPVGTDSGAIEGDSLAGSDMGPWRPTAVLFGAIVVLSAAGYLFGQRNRGRLRAAAILSLCLLALGTYKIVYVYQKAGDNYRQMDQLLIGVPPEARAHLPSFRDLFDIGPGTGLWMVAVGGLLGTVLAWIQLLRTPKPVLQGWLQPVSAPPPPGRPATPGGGNAAPGPMR